MDKLKEVFELQRTLQERLGNDLSKFDIEFFKLNHLALENELHEALRETNWKPWKKNQVLNLENVKKELIDVLHFYINLCLISGMDDEELYNLFTSKNRENHDRQEKGY